MDRQGLCMLTTGQFRPRTYAQVTPQDTNAIQLAVNQRPWAASLDASQLQFYSYGVYDGPCSTTNFTHFMTIIGYGNSGGKDYWRLENCWGTNWGQNGYMFIAKYSGYTRMPCGLPNGVAGPVL